MYLRNLFRLPSKKQKLFFYLIIMAFHILELVSTIIIMIEFSHNGWDEEAIFVYVNDLIKLRLFLPDPLTLSTAAGNGDGWAVWFVLPKKF